MGGNQDPNSPDYRPNSNEGRDVGDVGSGKDFGADIYKLYLAGRVRIPETANLYAEKANSLYSLSPTAVSWNSTHPAFNELSIILERLHEALCLSGESLHRTAEALVEIADDYVRTDEAARDEFNEYLKDDRTLGKFENSLPPLKSDNLPNEYRDPISPDKFGKEPNVPRRGMGEI